MKLVRMKPGHGDVLLAEGDPEVAEDEERLVEPSSAASSTTACGRRCRPRERGPPRGDDGPRLRRGPARRRAGDLLPAGRRRLSGAPSRSPPRPSGARASCCARSLGAEDCRAYERARLHQRRPAAATRERLRLPDLPAPAARRLRDRDRRAAERVLRPLPTTSGERLPDADDVLAKWMALHGDERELIADREHAPARPPGRPRPRAPRPRAALRALAATRQRLGRDEQRPTTLPAPALGRRLRRPRPRRRARLHEGDRLRRRRAQPADDRDRQHLDRGDAVQLPPARRSPSTIKEGVRAAGGTPMEFNTIAISDGITMGTKGMKTSLVSREVIADSIELTARGYQFDALVALSACDKTIPGCVMALARLDIPSRDALRRLDRARPLARQGRDDPRRLRGDRRPRRGRHDRRGAALARGRRQPRRRRLRRPVHREHDGLRLRGARDLARRLGDGPGRGRRARTPSPSRSASW